MVGRGGCSVPLVLRGRYSLDVIMVGMIFEISEGLFIYGMIRSISFYLLMLFIFSAIATVRAMSNDSLRFLPLHGPVAREQNPNMGLTSLPYGFPVA